MPAVWVIPYAFERGTKSEVAHKWGQCCIPPAVWESPIFLARGTKSEVAHKWAQWLHIPYRVGAHLCLIARGKIASGPQVGPVGK